LRGEVRGEWGGEAIGGEREEGGRDITHRSELIWEGLQAYGWWQWEVRGALGLSLRGWEEEKRRGGGEP
jgi:hypothetical protein